MSEVPRVILRDNQVVKLAYYNIRVFSSESDDEKLSSNNSLGRLILFLGFILLIISAIDSSQLSWTLTQSEQSIWPNSGKGIWIGLLVMNVGIFTIIAVKEKSHLSFQILFPYVIVSMIFSLFGLLTSLSVLDRYRKDPSLSQKENRNKEQNIQFALSGLLIGIFGLSFLFLSCLSCLICSTIPTFCKKSQGPHPQPFYLNRRLSQDIPLQTPRPIRNTIRYYLQPHRYPFNRNYQT